MLKNLQLFIFLFLATLSTNAQLIKGSIKNEGDTLLPGVTVKLLDSKNNLISEEATDKEGVFVFKNLSPTGEYNLVFSMIGYIDRTIKSIKIKENDSKNITVILAYNLKVLDAVLVTALGIKKAEKAVGYAAQSISTEDVNDARSNNFVNALSGKVAGLSLISPGSGPLNSVRVSLRGDASLNPNGNNALIVLDGVPMNSNIVSSGVSNAYGAGSGNDVPIDFGNAIGDINPDDIENITVLKGPAATALYGSRAANGALLVTTKSGAKKSKGLGITVNSNFSINDVLRWPDYQYEYGQGTGKQLNAAGEKYYSYGATADGASTSGTSSAFGPRFNGQSYFQYDPNREGAGLERTPWVPYKNNVKDFWRTGFTITNNIALEGGNDKNAARASLTHTKNEWIMPNTGFERVTAAVSSSYKISDRIKINTKVNYTNKRSDNLPATGYNNQSISYFMIFQNPNVDLKWYRPIWKKDKKDIDQVHPFSSFIDNPYLIAYEMTNSVRSNQVVANLSATYNVNKHIDVMLRSAIDLSVENREQRRPYSTANFQAGYFKQQNINYSEINNDVLISYNTEIKRNFKLNASAGANMMVRRSDILESYVTGLIIPAQYMLSNGNGTPITTATDANKNINSVYGLASLSWKNKIFLDVTGRNDWSSSLPTKYNSFFYPSVSNSIVISEILRLPKVISFAKTRLSLAQVGNDTRPYQTQKYYGTSPFPGSGSVPTLLFNNDFKPEISTNFEAGLDIRFFKNRFSLDATWYHNITENQILESPLDPTTGYTRAILNGGKIRNTGVELILNGKIIAAKKFKWNTIVTFSKNENRVLSLTEGVEDKQDIGYGGNATIQARVGGTTGDIYGFGFVRSPDGQVVYNTNGLPARPADIKYIGRAYADWKAGIRNEFSYNNIKFSFLFDGQHGGKVYSQTHHKMTEQGKLKHTLRGREENFIIGAGVVLGTDGKYTPNTTKVLPVDYYADYYRRANVESNTFDASYIKLREARIEYSLPKKYLNKFFNGVTFALYGRDLLMISNFPVFDPETAALNGSTILPGVEIGQMPTQRTFGANLTLKF